MSTNSKYILLQKLLLQGNKNSRLLSAWIALFVGCTLLLCSIMIWSGFQQILNSNESNNDSLGSTFLTVSKKINESGQKQNFVQQEDVQQILKAPQVEDAGLLTAANFKVSASMGSGPMSFYTMLFLEAAPDRFLDRLPENFKWQEGDPVLPIILSRDFLNMYNYLFAPSQGLPVLSEESVKAIGFVLTMGEGNNQTNFRAQVEGFSDRISSVLVPQSFMDFGNRHFNNTSEIKSTASRIIVKVADPSDKAFTEYLAKHQYTTNNEQLKWSKIRAIVEVVTSTVGVLAILFLLLGALVFVLFIELTMAKAQSAVQLLIQIGYSPKNLAGFLFKKYIPVVVSAVFMAIAICNNITIAIAKYLQSLQLNISFFPPMSVWISATICLGILLLQMGVSVRKAIKNK